MGKKSVTIKDIALKTGFSKSTVSRALLNDEHVNPETKEIILKCANDLNFHPNFFAKGLKSQKSKTIAFFVPNIEIMIYPAIIQAMEAETRKRGYLILLCDIQEDKEIAKEYVRRLTSRNVDGFIFSTAFSDTEKNEEIKAVLDAAIPCVNLLRTDDSPIPSIVLDNEEGSRIGVEYLVKNGKTRIAYLQGQEYLSLYDGRLKGYIESLKSHNIEFDSSLIWNGYNGKERIASKVVKEKIKEVEKIDAIFSSSDNLAIDAIHALSEEGIKIPEDISLLGYDNVPLSELFMPSLSTIAQPIKEMGAKAVEVLIDIIEGRSEMKKERYVFSPYLIERNTVKFTHIN